VSRRVCVELVAAEKARVDAVVDENRTFGDGVLALQLADLLAHAQDRALEPAPIYEAPYDVPAVLPSGAKCRLTGLVAADASLYLTDEEACVAQLGQYSVVCWDGAAPAGRGIIKEYTTSFTGVLEAALAQHPHLVCAAFVPDAEAALPWAAVAASFPDRVLFFRAAPRAWGPAPSAPAMGDLPTISVGLGDGALCEEFERHTRSGTSSWTVYPTGSDVWGGMALTTPCVYEPSASPSVRALNGKWTLLQAEDGEWILE